MERKSREKLESILTELPPTGRLLEFTKLFPHSSRIEADAADNRWQAGFQRGHLDGAIISIKDLFDVCGETTTAGTSLLSDNPVAKADAEVVRRLRNAGAVIIGRTNMSEYAFSGVGINATFGTPGNALDPARIPGGSSSGAAVSVAIGSSEMSVGTDTGGSCRIPAALNGCVGFKPSHDSIPTTGAFPLAPSLDCIGPIARNVEDCAQLFAVLSGQHFKCLNKQNGQGIRLAVGRGRFLWESDKRIEKMFEHTIQLFASRGAQLVDIEVDHLWSDMLSAFPAPLVTIEAFAVHKDNFLTRPEVFDRRVYERIQMGKDCHASDYIKGLQHRRLLIEKLGQMIETFDAFVTPTVPIYAPEISHLEEDDTKFQSINRLLLRNSSFANLFDLSSISLPIIDENRSAGITLSSLKGRDHSLLDTSSIVESWMQQY